MDQKQAIAIPEMEVLKDVVLFDFIIGGSTGEKTVEADDFIREVGKMLPKGAFSWVSKYRSEAKREILKVGAARRVNNRVRGYFVPIGSAQGLSEKLKQIKAGFLTEKADFLLKLPKIVDDWANNKVNAGVTKSGSNRSDLIRFHAPKAADLDPMLSFEISAIRVQSTGFFGEDDALHSEVKGLVGQAAMEIAEDVRKSWKGPTSGRTSSRVLGLIRRIRNKAEAMGVISSKFSRLAEMCDKVLGAVPNGQNIEGLQFLIVSSLLSRCMKAESILADDSVQYDPLDVQLPAEGLMEQGHQDVGFDQSLGLDLAPQLDLPNNEASSTEVATEPVPRKEQEAFVDLVL